MNSEIICTVSFSNQTPFTKTQIDPLTIKEVNPASVEPSSPCSSGRSVCMLPSRHQCYHQPGVEAGKKGSRIGLEVRSRSRSPAWEKRRGHDRRTSRSGSRVPDKAGWVFKILENLSVNQPESFERTPRKHLRKPVPGSLVKTLVGWEPAHLAWMEVAVGSGGPLLMGFNRRENSACSQCGGRQDRWQNYPHELRIGDNDFWG